MHFFILSAELNPVLGADQGAAAVVAPATETGTAVAAPAAAPAPAQEPGFNMWWMYGIWAAVIVGFYFLTIRPQRKRDKKMREMQSSLKVGDNVLCSNGFFGRIADVGDDCFVVEFGTNRGVRIPIRKTDVLGVQEPKLTKTPTPIAD